MKYLIEIEEICVEVEHKSIKNLILKISSRDGIPRISAPKRMKQEEVRKFIISKIEWLRKNLTKYQKQKREEPKEYKDDEMHYYFGREYKMNINYIEKGEGVKFEDDIILLRIKEGRTKEERRLILERWYYNELKRVLPVFIRRWEGVMGLKVGSFGIRKMKTRWGTCNTRTKKIWINLEFAKKSGTALDYIIVHEMVHLLERGHNKRFYGFMDRYLPGWREYKKELNSMFSFD